MDIAWDLTKINYALKTSQWFIEPDTHMLTLRATQYIPDRGTASDLMYRIVSECGRIADDYYPTLTSMLL